MKTLKMIAALLLIAGLNKLHAQMAGVSSYQISNGSMCDVTVHYEVTDCTQIVCYGDVVIQANSGFFLPSSCLGAGHDLQVWLKEMNYVDVTGGSAAYACTIQGGCFGGSQFNVSVPLSSVGATVSCNTTGYYNVVVVSTNTHITD